MTIGHAQTTVAATATPLETPSTLWGSRVPVSVVFQNNSTAIMYLGGSSVTTSNYGYKLAVGGEVFIDLGPSDVMYAVVASGTAVLNALTASGRRT